MINSRVSIIMPIFNRAKFLSETIASVLSQTYFDWELVIVDDGSTDDSVKILSDFISQFPNKIFFYFSEHAQSGPAACRNIGLKHATGQYVIFLDSDDLLEPFCLEQRVEVMEHNKSLDWAIFSQYALDTPFQKTPRIFNKPFSNTDEAIGYFLSQNTPWQTTAPIWTKSTLIRLNGFDESLFFMEDPDLHLRALISPDINYKNCIQYTPDSFYRLNNFDNNKLLTFFDTSIRSRILFFHKWLVLLESNSNFDLYKKFLRNGFFRLLRSFVLVRWSYYNDEIANLIQSLSRDGVISKTDRLKLSISKLIYQKNSFLISFFRLRGIINNWILPKI